MTSFYITIVTQIHLKFHKHWFYYCIFTHVQHRQMQCHHSKTIKLVRSDSWLGAAGMINISNLQCSTKNWTAPSLFPPSQGSTCRVPSRAEIHLCSSLSGQRWWLLGNSDIPLAEGGNVNSCPSLSCGIQAGNRSSEFWWLSHYNTHPGYFLPLLPSSGFNMNIQIFESY